MRMPIPQPPRPAVTADAVLDAALTLFAERGHHGRHPMYAQAWAGPTGPHGGC